MNKNFPSSFKPINQENQFQGMPKSFQPIGKKKQEENSNDQEPKYNPFLEEDSLEKEIERHSARLTSRGLETIAGIPGDIREVAKFSKKYYDENIKPKIPHLNIKEPESFKQFDETIKPIMDSISNIADWFPTSSELKETSEELTKGYTSPKTPFEERGDEMFQGIVSSFIPGQGSKSVWRNLIAPIGSVIAKDFVKDLGGNEKQQAITQIGTNLFLSLMGGNANKYNAKLWNQIESTAPNITQTVNVAPQRAKARSLINHIEKTMLGAEGEKKVISTLERFINNTQGNKLSAEQLVNMNKSINEIRGDPALLKGSRKLLNEVSEIVKDSGKGFKQAAPDFYNVWKNGNEVHSAIEKSNFISNIVGKIGDKNFKSNGVRDLVMLASHGGLATVKNLPPIFALYKGTQILTRIANSKELSKYYRDVLLNSIKGNTAATAAAMSKLDNKLYKLEKENPNLLESEDIYIEK